MQKAATSSTQPSSFRTALLCIALFGYGDGGGGGVQEIRHCGIMVLFQTRVSNFSETLVHPPPQPHTSPQPTESSTTFFDALDGWMHAMRHVPLWNSCKVCIRAPSDSAPPPTKALGCGGRRFGGLDDDTQCLEPLSPEIQLLGFGV